jgi:hypothetical protein
LHRGHTVVSELEGIVGEELHLAIVEEEDESFGYVAGDFDIRQVIASDEVIFRADFKVVLVNDKYHPHSRASIARGTEGSPELHLFGPRPWLFPN